MPWIPGEGRFGALGTPGVMPAGYPGYARPGWGAVGVAGAIETASVIANANALNTTMQIQAAQAQAAAVAQAQANAAAMAAANSRPAIVQMVQAHLVAVGPAVATNPEAAGHLAAASQLVAQLV